MAYKIPKRKERVEISKSVFKLKNGKYIKGYKVIYFKGIFPELVWGTTDKKEALKFKKTMES